MNKLSRSTLGLFFAVTFALHAAEFLNLAELAPLAVSATIDRFPDADDVVLDNFTQSAYQPDGTSVVWDDSAVKILTERGKRDNQTLSLAFNTSYGTAEFKLVQIIKPDGTVLAIDIEAQSKEMIDPRQMSSNIYNPNSKQLTLSVPGLEIGDTLRYVTRREAIATVVPNAWSDYRVFEYTAPILKTTYQVIAPAALPLKKKALKAEIPGTVTFDETVPEDGKTIVYTWRVKDVPRVFEEPGMPTFYTVVQRLLISTVDEWEDLSRWYWKLCEPHLAVTPEMEAKAQELTANCSTVREKTEAIFSFVSQEIRYMGITTEDEAPGYEPHDARITFENRYGVCRDKAALLAALLRAVDVEAFPVIIMSGPKKDEEVPQPFFNHAVTAALDDDGEYILMDSTDENTKDIFPSYLQNMSYLVARPEGETLLTSPIIPAEENLAKISTTGNLSQDGTLTAETRIIFEGINDTIFRGYFSQLKPEELQRFFEGQLKHAIPTAELQSVTVRPTELRDTTQPLSATLTYTAKNLLIEGDANKLMELPVLGGTVGYVNYLIGQTGLEKRVYPLVTAMTAGVIETLQIDLPENTGHLHIPDYETIATPEITWQRNVTATNGQIACNATFLIDTVEFSPENYLELKKHLRAIEYNQRKKLIFEVGPERALPSDVRIVEHTTDVTLDDASNWKKTTHAKIEILTYAGKKDYAELKFAYNPAWQTLNLTHAEVTAPDGSVKTLRNEELNIMDAGWVSSAPRYPAEKVLVANLPSVDIGSVIEYTVELVCTDVPFFSDIQTFSDFNLIGQKTFTVTAPETLNLTVQNHDISETRSSGDGNTTYRWSVAEQAPVKKEERLPPWWTFNPAVFVSCGHWETYAGQVHEKLEMATRRQPETAQLAKELTAHLSSDERKIVALRDWTAKNLRSAGPGFTELPLSSITPADRTLRERYGNNADRMVVLYTLLKHAQLKPDFVLSGGVSLIPEAATPLINIPSRTAFSTVLIRIKHGNETLYLDGSSQYAQLGTSAYNHRPLLDLKSGIISSVRVTTSMEDRSHHTFEMNVEPSGLVGITHTTLKQGTQFEDFHGLFAEITPEKRRRMHLEMVAGISQSAQAASGLDANYSVYPGKLSYSITAENYTVKDGEYLYFTIPSGLGNLLQYRSATRENPLAWTQYTNTLLEYNIALPDGYEPVLLPKNFSWQAPGGAGLVEVAVEYSARANAVRIVQMADIRPALIPAKDYPAVIEAGRTLAHPAMQTLLLKKKRNP